MGQYSEKYGYEIAQGLDSLKIENQMAMEIDPICNEAVAVEDKQGYSPIADLSPFSVNQTQADVKQTLHEAVVGFEPLGYSGDVNSMSDYVEGLSDKAMFLTESAQEAIMVHEADVDTANLNVFSNQDMPKMLTKAHEKN